MVFVEFPNFTKQVTELLGDEDYRKLQAALIANPELGDLIRGTGGLRKARWSAKGRGKRGGVRVIYYWITRRYQVLMLLIYPKSARDDLTADERKLLAKLVERELADG
jgi:mRNA-degrading endonuclease RelE of RelBE toxin-antitoxin system